MIQVMVIVNKNSKNVILEFPHITNLKITDNIFTFDCPIANTVLIAHAFEHTSWVESFTITRT